MQILSSEQVAEQLTGLVHLDTQQSATGVDLTAGSIHRVTGPGRLDFGGSEYEEVEYEPIEPQRYQPDDDYGWWELKAGTYRVRYNESIAPGEGHIAFVFPHERLLKAGAHHPAFCIGEARDPFGILLTVGERGVRIKENSRVSTLVILER